MKKKTIVFSVATVLLVVISGGLGYITAYVRGLTKANDVHVRAYCDVLELESLTMTRKAKSSGISGLIDAVAQNCEGHASFIRVNKPYRPADTRERIAEALEAWDEAKKEVEALKIVHTEEQPP